MKNFTPPGPLHSPTHPPRSPEMPRSRGDGASPDLPRRPATRSQPGRIAHGVTTPPAPARAPTPTFLTGKASPPSAPATSRQDAARPALGKSCRWRARRRSSSRSRAPKVRRSREIGRDASRRQPTSASSRVHAAAGQAHQESRLLGRHRPLMRPSPGGSYDGARGHVPCGGTLLRPSRRLVRRAAP